MYLFSPLKFFVYYINVNTFKSANTPFCHLTFLIYIIKSERYGKSTTEALFSLFSKHFQG